MTEFVLNPAWRQIVARQTIAGGRRLALRAMTLAVEICPRSGGGGGSDGNGLPLYASHFHTESMSAEFGWIIRVGAAKSYAYYVHQGTSPHEIFGKPVLSFIWPGGPHGDGRYFFTHVHHPGTRPQPWLWGAVSIVIRSRV